MSMTTPVMLATMTPMIRSPARSAMARIPLSAADNVSLICYQTSAPAVSRPKQSAVLWRGSNVGTIRERRRAACRILGRQAADRLAAASAAAVGTRLQGARDHAHEGVVGALHPLRIFERDVMPGGAADEDRLAVEDAVAPVAGHDQPTGSPHQIRDPLAVHVGRRVHVRFDTPGLRCRVNGKPRGAVRRDESRALPARVG